MRTVLFSVLAAAALAASCSRPSPPPEPPPLASPSAAPPPEAPPGRVALRPSDVDAELRAEWQKAGMAPAPTVDDARFLRRAYIDIVGTIPTADVVTAFLADRAPDKRAKLVEGLLASPRYAQHWTDKWDRTLMGREVRRNVVDQEEFRSWLRPKLAQNVGYNRIVYDILTATGRNTHKGESAMGEPTPAASASSAPPGTDPVNGAVNYLLKFENPADLTGTTSRVFLGVQIQCAQCHDHKTEKWKREDFDRLAACFMQTKAEPLERGKTMGTRLFELKDVPKPNAKGPGKAKAAMGGDYARATPTALDGTDFSTAPNRRVALATWMTAPQNPWFADAIVNRMWAHFLGRGFVEPIDDFRPGNPAVAPELLKKLSAEFVASGYDLKALVRLITGTEAYQRAAAPSKKEGDGRLWAHFRLAPMGPDELVESLVTATNMEALLAKNGNADLDQVKAGIRKQFTFLFDVDEEQAGDDDFDGTIPQVLLLLNGRLTTQGVSAVPGSALNDVLALPGGDDVKIRALYLRALSREPNAEELARWTTFVTAPREWVFPNTAAPPPPPEPKGKGKKGAPPDPLAKMDKKMQKQQGKAGDPKRQAYEDMFWTLLNSSEFLFNHLASEAHHERRPIAVR